MTTASYLAGWLRWVVRSWLPWALGCVGYWVRPYDMLADARRWRWQKPQPCGAPHEVIRFARAAMGATECICSTPVPWVQYDANGHARWCGGCGAAL